ncbi:MAG: sulfatase-like hydrolase/transferase [Akkermansiaceae bacterium]|nr:sulfatase-like hydrolase/transferase [Akkermansiaceae bacterium]
MKTLLTLFLSCSASLVIGANIKQPNIILVMCDDLGWGDVGFNGGTTIKTPHLDTMASQSLVFDRFYSASAVCSPTRGSVVTGRNPYRYGIVTANKGHMKPEEFTIYEALKTVGYRTGHFGKWHLGTLTKTVKESNRGGPKGVKDYSPPWDNGVDVTFATEAKVPTYDPMDKPGPKTQGDFRKPSKQGWWPVGEDAEHDAYGTHYWTGPGQMVDPKTLKGDDSKIIVDHAIPFIKENAQNKNPFLAVIWLHAPHLPVVAGKEHTDLYPDADGFHANYYGCVSAIDDQVGRLRKTLRDLGIADNTLLAFTSDNGPEGDAKSPGSAADFSGRKRSLHEGGIRVPGLIEWPAKMKTPTRTDVPAGTMDYFSTIMAITGFKMPDARPLDGINLLPLLDGTMKKRPAPIGFLFGSQSAWTDNQYKIYKGKKGKGWELYDITKDPSEKSDFAKTKPEVLAQMTKAFGVWSKSVDHSASGGDYNK